MHMFFSTQDVSISIYKRVGIDYNVWKQRDKFYTCS